MVLLVFGSKASSGSSFYDTHNCYFSLQPLSYILARLKGIDGWITLGGGSRRRVAKTQKEN